MSMPNPGLMPVVRFPNFHELEDLNILSVVVQDLSITYDLTAMAVLPGYEQVVLPAERIGPRRRSPLRSSDRLKVQRVSLASPLEVIFWVASASTSVDLAARAGSRVAHAAKAWVDVLAAGTDLRQRAQVLEQSRLLAPVELQQAQLENALKAQALRRVTAEADIVTGLRDEYVQASMTDDHDRSPLVQQRVLTRRLADSMTSADFADLLDDPVRRMLGLSGGELEVAGDSGATDSGTEMAGGQRD